MRFYLGAPEPSWLARTTTPLFVSRPRIIGRNWRGRARGAWALDSGGFTELANGGWSISARDYVDVVRFCRDEIGGLEWAAPMDWMCEPDQLRATGLTIDEHQRRTVNNYLELRGLDDTLPIVPALQGWRRDDYLRCVELYDRAGVDLADAPLVGLGTICRRQATDEAARIVAALTDLDITLHGFGVKLDGLRRFGAQLASSDSQAWSSHARAEKIRLPGHSHANCNYCLEYAERWLAEKLTPITRTPMIRPLQEVLL